MAERRRRFPASLTVGLIMGGLLVLIAIAAPIFLGSAAQDLGPLTRALPSAEHWLGTDDLGRDIVARTLVATRLTLLMSAAATVMSVVAGVLIGSLIWLGPRQVREAVLRLIDSTVAFPSLILALVIAAVLGAGTIPAVFAIGIAGIPSFARITSNLTAGVVHKDYVGTARLLGVPGWRLFTRHLLPNILGPLLVLVASSFALSLLEISSLSFVGLGVQSPDFDWGRLLNEGLPAIYSQPMQVLAPSAMLIFAGVTAMLIGDGIAAYIDPWGHQPRVRFSRRDLGAGESQSPQALVEVRDLVVTTAEGKQLVKGVSFEVAPGEILGLVGESGSGKSMTAMSLAQLHPDSVRREASLMRVGDLDLRVRASRSRLAKEIGLVYQDPGTTFNPALRMGTQLTEVARVHLGMSAKEAHQVLVSALEKMHITQAPHRMRQYPFQLSGGMLQRAVIASSLVTNPKLIIADEPTTALDVTVQAEVLRQLKHINRVEGAAVLFISHDIGVVKAVCDRVLVMKAGEIVEELTANQLAAGDVRHEYTKALLAATPTLELVPRGAESEAHDG